LAVTTDNQDADPGYRGVSPNNKVSNATLSEGIVLGDRSPMPRDFIGGRLSNAEMGALERLLGGKNLTGYVRDIFPDLPENLSDIALTVSGTQSRDEMDPAVRATQPLPLASLSPAETAQFNEIIRRIDAQDMQNGNHTIRERLEQEINKSLNRAESAQIRLEDLPAHILAMPTSEQIVFKRVLEENRVKEEAARRDSADPHSAENDEVEVSEITLAFIGNIIGGDQRAQRVRKYHEDADEDGISTLDRRIEDGQMMMDVAQLSSSYTSFANDIRSYKLTPDQVKYYTELVDKYEEDLAKLREDQQNTQAELAVVKERIAAAKTELTTIEAGVTDTEQTLQYTYEAIDAITEARENAALVELPAAYRDFNAIGDEAARGMGIDPANAWVYKDESGQYVLMNLDFTTNEGGRTTAITDPEILKRLQEADAKIDEVRETVDFHDESLKYFRETFIPEQQQNLLTLKQQAEDLKAQIEADQSRATELQGKLDSLNTQITDIETKMAEAQLKLDYNTFLSNDDVGNRLDIIANTDRPLAERQKAAQELLDMAPENVRNHLLEKYPTVFNSEATPTQTSKAAVTAEAAPAAVGDALSGLAADKAAEGTPQTPKLEQPDPAPTNLDQRAENTSRTGLSAANDVDGPAIAYNGSLSAMYAYANLPRDIPLDKPQPVTASVDLAMTDQNKKFTSSAPSFTA